MTARIDIDHLPTTSPIFVGRQDELALAGEEAPRPGEEFVGRGCSLLVRPLAVEGPAEDAGVVVVTSGEDANGWGKPDILMAKRIGERK